MDKVIWLLLFVFAAFCSCSPVVETSEEFVVNGRFDLEESVAYLDKIIDHDGKNADALYQRAGLELQLSRTLKAKEDVTAALSVEPQNTNFLMLKAKIDNALGQYADAVATVEYVLKQNASLNTIEAQLFATDLYLKINNLNKAEYFLQQAIASAPEMKEVMFYRARLYEINHDTGKAISFYRHVLARDSAHTGSLLGLSEINFNRRHIDTTLRLLGKVKDGSGIQYNLLVARALMANKMVDSAAKFWGKVLLLSPRNAEAHYELGKYYFIKGIYPNASAHFAAVPENEKRKFGDFYLLYARASEKLADSAKAVALYKIAYEKDSTLRIKKEVKPRRRPRVIVPDPAPVTDSVK